jgi:predicted RNA binding protein YcfA (HicA-like mRNA interferase family)
MSSREVIRRLLDDGWFEVAQVDGHVQFKHAKGWASHCASSEAGHTNRHVEEY